jgi:hypothetical protein
MRLFSKEEVLLSEKIYGFILPLNLKDFKLFDKDEIEEDRGYD